MTFCGISLAHGELFEQRFYGGGWAPRFLHSFFVGLKIVDVDCAIVCPQVSEDEDGFDTGIYRACMF